MLSACRHILRLPGWELDIILQTQLASFPVNWNLGKSGLPVNYMYWPWFNVLHGHALTDLNGHFFLQNSSIWAIQYFAWLWPDLPCLNIPEQGWKSVKEWGGYSFDCFHIWPWKSAHVLLIATDALKPTTEQTLRKNRATSSFQVKA